MAIYATNAKRVTDEMFIEAAHAVADQVTAVQLKQGMLFPPQSSILEVEIQTAARVAKLVFDAGLARVDRPADIVAFIREHVYKPEYQTSWPLQWRWPKPQSEDTASKQGGISSL
jgi:malate dehydrogenase (oxaloacetate-decarboxylating)(NADP+)